jgi:DNA-binding NtrC family response regulator
VDDNHNMARSLASILRLKGYAAEAVSSSLQALEMVRSDNWACLISDIKMPDISGVDLCREAKVLYPDLPVVLMTAYSTDSLVEEGLRGGALACLKKPLRIEALLELLADLVGTPLRCQEQQQRKANEP